MSVIVAIRGERGSYNVVLNGAFANVIVAIRAREGATTAIEEVAKGRKL